MNSTVKEPRVPKAFMYSFGMDCESTPRNIKMVERACQMRVEEIQNAILKEAQDNLRDERSSKIGKECTLSYEVIEGMDQVRVNVFGATAKDIMMIGYNFCSLQMNPGWL